MTNYTKQQFEHDALEVIRECKVEETPASIEDLAVALAGAEIERLIEEIERAKETIDNLWWLFIDEEDRPHDVHKVIQSLRRLIGENDIRLEELGNIITVVEGRETSCTKS